MKEGSLVVVLPTHKPNDGALPHIKWLPINDGKTIYTVREIVDDIVLFEEGIIGNFLQMEIGISIEFVREIQPPEEGASILENVFENQLV